MTPPISKPSMQPHTRPDAQNPGHWEGLIVHNTGETETIASSPDRQKAAEAATSEILIRMRAASNPYNGCVKGRPAASAAPAA